MDPPNCVWWSVVQFIFDLQMPDAVIDCVSIMSDVLIIEVEKGETQHGKPLCSRYMSLLALACDSLCRLRLSRAMPS